MAKRVVQECDLTKQEYDPSETVTLVIKRAGKKAGRTYELSAEAASKLEQQLVAGLKLDTNWGFSSSQGSTRSTAKTLGDLEDESEAEIESDEAFIAEKISQRRAIAETDEGDELAEAIKPEGGCYHMNKGPIQTTMRAGKRQIYRVCRECRERIPEKRKDDKSKFMNAKAPADSRQGYRGEE